GLTIVAGMHGPATISGGPSLFVGGPSSFTNQSSGGAISLGGVNALFGPISLNTTGAGGDASLTNTGGGGPGFGTTLAASNVSGNLVVNTTGNLTQSGPLTVAGTSGFTAAIGTITLTNAANSLSGAVSLNTSGASPPSGNASLTNDAATG